MKLGKQLRARIEKISAPSRIKNPSPFLTAIYASKNPATPSSTFEEFLAANQTSSSYETAAGKMVEDIVPNSYGWQQLKSDSHSALSEIDCFKIKDNI